MKEITQAHINDVVSTDEYYTPLPLIQSLGHFDTDPATPIGFRWQTADVMYDKNDNGLTQEWKGRVWLNPPYSKQLITDFMEKMAKHGNGIALVLPKFGTKLFKEWVYPYADAIFVMYERVKFYDMNYIQQKSPISQSVLIAYGEENVAAILASGIKGKMMYLKR